MIIVCYSVSNLRHTNMFQVLFKVSLYILFKLLVCRMAKVWPIKQWCKDESENCYTNIIVQFTFFLKVMNYNKDRILFEKIHLSWKRFTRIKLLQQWRFILLPARSWHCVVWYTVQRNILPPLQGRILYTDQQMYLIKYKS